MEPKELEAVLEACLATAGQPVPAGVLASAAGDETLAEEAVDAALEAMAERWRSEGRGIRLEKVAGGWRMVTAPELDPYLRSLHGSTGTSKLSSAALEVLAIVAYRQPVTLPEVNFIRGVNSSSALRTLLDRGLVRVAGRKNVVGKPFLYRTTTAFLVHFGLESLRDLPKPEEVLGEETSAAGVLDEGVSEMNRQDRSG